MLITLLLVCVFSPYGMLPDPLRLDHLVVPGIFILALARGWLRTPPVLAVALFLQVWIAVIASLFFWRYLAGGPIEAYKNLDGLLRGPIVLTIAASLAVRPEGLRRILGTFVVVAVVFVGMGIVDRLLPDSVAAARLTEMYGGTAYTNGFADEFGANHKALMLLVGRASAVFVTAPALAMAAVFMLGMAIVPGMPITAGRRRLLLVSALMAGLLSNSKSFLLGVAVLVLLSLLSARPKQLLGGLAAGALVFGTLAVLAYQGLDEVLPVNPLAGGNLRSLEMLTGGRLGDDDWSIWDTTLTVLRESPTIGYGLGYRPSVIYSDSALNRFLLHGGLLATLVVAVGIVAQLRWFWRRRRLSPWTIVGYRTLVLSVAFFLAAAIFMMPRVNDILFIVIGVAVAATREAARAVRTATMNATSVISGA